MDFDPSSMDQFCGQQRGFRQRIIEMVEIINRRADAGINPNKPQNDGPKTRVEGDRSTGAIVDLDLSLEEPNGNKQKHVAAITVADMIGEFGFYQLSLTLLAFVRYLCVAMMTTPQPVIAPELDFWCHMPNASLAERVKIWPPNANLTDYLKNKCEVQLVDNGTYQCQSWTYDTQNYGITLTESFNLICNDDFLRSTFSSTVSIGVALANVIWGSFSDVHGRNSAIRACFLCSLLGGLISYLATNYITYIISRAVCSFGDLGLVVSLTTILVESLGNKYRGPICIVVYTGWSMGVMTLPWMANYFRDYKHLMLFTVGCHLATLPWLLTVSESVRWLMVNGRYEEASRELKRISRLNGRGDERSIQVLEDKFVSYRRAFVSGTSGGVECRQVIEKIEASDSSWLMKRTKVICHSLLGGLSKVKKLFQGREMALATATMIWLTFNGELLYMLSILFNSELGEDTKLNYNIGFVMEVLATFASIVMISKMTRKLSLIGTLVSTAILGFALAFSDKVSLLSVFLLHSGKFLISTLTSLIFVATTELFPTNLRQSGVGLCGTLGSAGAVVAPFLNTELDNLIGPRNVKLIVFMFPLTAAAIIPLFLRETKGVELADEIEDSTNDSNKNLDSSALGRKSDNNNNRPQVIEAAR